MERCTNLKLLELDQHPEEQRASILLKVTQPIGGRPGLDPRWPKTMPGDREAVGDFGGYSAPIFAPILFHFLLVNPCEPLSCPAS